MAEHTMSAGMLHSLALLTLLGWALWLFPRRPGQWAGLRWLFVAVLLLNLRPWLVSLGSQRELTRITPVSGQAVALTFPAARRTLWELSLQPAAGVPAAGDWPTRHAVKVAWNGQALDPEEFMEDTALLVLLPREQARMFNRLHLSFAPMETPQALRITVRDLEYQGFGLGRLRALLLVAFSHGLLLLVPALAAWRRTSRF